MELRKMLLQRLTGSRGVVLQSSELGPAVPITSDPAVCSRFYRPWSLRCCVARVGDVYSIEAPLAQLGAEVESRICRVGFNTNRRLPLS